MSMREIVKRRIEPKIKKISKELAEVVAVGLEKPEKARPAVDEFITEFFILSDNLDCIRLMTTTETWYLCLKRVYESTDKINVYGFLVEADVPPLSTYSYSIDLTQTNVCCVCPKFICSSDLGRYAKLTNLVNESPTDFKTKRWENKYAARNMPMPTEIGPSLQYGFDYVVFPKRKVKVTFTNTHSTETAYCVFFADYMEMNIDLALHYMVNIYDYMVDKLLEIMFAPRAKEELKR